MPTHPDRTSAVAGAAKISSGFGQDVAAYRYENVPADALARSR
jgi:hypothetical protein